MRVAVLIPAYNSARTLPETLAALAAQDELATIVSAVHLAGDGSTDGTPEMAERTWGGRVPLRVHRAPANQGERRTVNAAMERLRDEADWVLVVHADDVPAPTWVRTMRDTAAAAPLDVATVSSSWTTFSDDGTEEPGEDRPGVPPEHIRGTSKAVRDTLRKGCWWHISGCALRTRAFEDVGPFDPEMPQLGDLDWLLRCLHGGNGVLYVPQSLLRYRQHAGSVSSASFREHRDVAEFRRILGRYRGVLSRDERRVLLCRQALTLVRRMARSVVSRDLRRGVGAARLLRQTLGDYLV